MVDATQILGELLGAGKRQTGSLNSGSGAKMLEDLLGVGSAQQSGQQPGNRNAGGGVFGGGDQNTGVSGDQQQGGGGIFGGGSQPTNSGRQAPAGAGGLGDLLGKALKELTGAQSGGTVASGAGAGSGSGSNPFEMPQQAPQADNKQQSEVYIRAMIQAGLSDGRLDDQEQQAILQKVGNLGQAESDFIRAEIGKGGDVNAFIQSVPRGIEEEVYAVSLMAIQLDNRAEAQYLDAVAKGLRITQEQSNAIHDRLGAQRLYS